MRFDLICNTTYMCVYIYIIKLYNTPMPYYTYGMEVSDGKPDLRVPARSGELRLAASRCSRISRLGFWGWELLETPTWPC